LEEKEILAVLNKYKKIKRKKYRDILVAEYLSLVRAISWKLCLRKDQFNDVIQVGLMGFLKAIDNFKANNLTEFTKYATKKVIGEIKHFMRDKTKSIKIPRKYIESSTKVSKFIQAFIQTTKGKHPNVQQISEGTGINEELILETLEATNAFYNMPLEISDKYTISVSDTAFQTEQGAGGKNKDQTNEDNLLERIYLDKVMKDLTYHEKKVLRMHFWRNLSQREMAERIGLSQTQVYRILQKALNRCREIINLEK